MSARPRAHSVRPYRTWKGWTPRPSCGIILLYAWAAAVLPVTDFLVDIKLLAQEGIAHMIKE